MNNMRGQHFRDPQTKDRTAVLAASIGSFPYSGLSRADPIRANSRRFATIRVNPLQLPLAKVPHPVTEPASPG